MVLNKNNQSTNQWVVNSELKLSFLLCHVSMSTVVRVSSW